MGDLGRRHRRHRIRRPVAVHLVLCRNAVSDLRRNAAGRRAQRHDQTARPRCQPASFAAADDRMPGARGVVVRRGVPRRRHHRAAGNRAEQHDQIATGKRQGLPREERHRYQLSRLRQCCRVDFGGSDARDARDATDAQSPQRRRDCLKRRRDRQSDAQTAAGHGERCRQFLHRAVSGPGVRSAAERLSYRPAVYGPHASPCPRDTDCRSHRRYAGTLADRTDHHHVRGLCRDLDRPGDHRYPEFVHPGHPGRAACLHPDAWGRYSGD